jgi:hypothetical protein
MTGEPDLISLLHRADWTRLSLSAEVNDGSTLLIAPGRRYRVQTGEYVDAELGILLRLTSYMGGKPVRQYELRDITTGTGDFRVDIPPGLPTFEETGPFGDARDAGPSRPVNIPLKVASEVARQVATEATKAARNFLRRMNTR